MSESWLRFRLIEILSRGIDLSSPVKGNKLSSINEDGDVSHDGFQLDRLPGMFF